MPRLPESLQTYNTEQFNPTLKHELKSIDSGLFPLHLGTTQGGIVDDSQIAFSIINSRADAETIRAKVGVFFNEVIGGCSCGDDPLSENAYCEIWVVINRQTAETEFSIFSE